MRRHRAPRSRTVLRVVEIKSGGYPKVSDPTEGSIEPRSLLELALFHSLAGLLPEDFDVPSAIEHSLFEI